MRQSLENIGLEAAKGVRHGSDYDNIRIFDFTNLLRVRWRHGPGEPA
jgi:hypothetical protein